MTDEKLLNFALDIVYAHATHNYVGPAQLPSLIETVYSALEGLGKSTPVIDEKRKPAVAIRSSIKPDAITCLECGAGQKMLKRHLSVQHQLSPAEYKARWGLSDDYPLVAPNYSVKRRDLAIEIGLGRRLGTKLKPAAKPKRGDIRKPRAAKAAAAPVETRPGNHA